MSEEYRIEKCENSLNILGIGFPIVFHTDLCYHQQCEEKILSLEEATKLLDETIRIEKKVNLQM